MSLIYGPPAECNTPLHTWLYYTQGEINEHPCTETTWEGTTTWWADAQKKEQPQLPLLDNKKDIAVEGSNQLSKVKTHDTSSGKEAAMRKGTNVELPPIYIHIHVPVSGETEVRVEGPDERATESNNAYHTSLVEPALGRNFGFIKSPNHPYDYPNDAHYVYNITTTLDTRVALRFLRLSVERCCDFVSVYDDDGGDYL
jgi:hypothetical protein